MTKYASMCFEKIGQGLFYTGELANSLHSFRFVYDCGSLSRAPYLSEAIDRFRVTIDFFDMIVISHFDEDHVNGIADLIRNKKVKLLILPYVSWIERLMVYAHSTSRDEAYIRLLRDPIAFFSDGNNFDIDSIVVVGSPDISPSLDPDLLPRSPDGKADTRVSNEKGMSVRIMTGKIADQEILENMVNVLLAKVDSAAEFRGDLAFYKTPFSIVAGDFWEFHFYNLQSTDTKLQSKFQKVLNAWMEKEGIKVRDIFDEGYRSGVRTVYKRFYKNLNQTSLILYHGPLGNQNTVDFSYPEVISNEKSGTLLTGDLNINSTRVLADLCAYYRDYIPRTGIFLVPHHAAYANWHFRHPSDLEDFEAYIVSAGANRKNHPSRYVLNDIRTYCTGEIFHSNEGQSYPYFVFLQ